MIIVTGANGFIGSAIVWELNKQGLHNILCVDSIDLKSRPQLLANKKYSEFINHDNLLDNLNSYKRKVSWIVHMGACSDTTEMNVEFLKKNNTQYTETLFKWCSDNNVPFIYASSGAIYGSGTQGFDDQTDPKVFSPLNPYGHSKHIFDCWALQQQKTPPHWYGLRFFNVYGPNEYFKGAMSSVVYKAFKEITTTGSLKLFKSHRKDYADGLQKRDFVYIKDITHWICEIMDKKINSGIYNLGFGKARTWMDLADNTFKQINLPKKINWIDIPENIRNQYQYFTEAKMEKLWQQKVSPPQWSLEKGIEDYLSNYLKKNEAIL